MGMVDIEGVFYTAIDNKKINECIYNLIIELKSKCSDNINVTNGNETITTKYYKNHYIYIINYKDFNYCLIDNHLSIDTTIDAHQVNIFSCDNISLDEVILNIDENYFYKPKREYNSIDYLFRDDVSHKHIYPTEYGRLFIMIFNIDMIRKFLNREK